MLHSYVHYPSEIFSESALPWRCIFCIVASKQSRNHNFDHMEPTSDKTSTREVMFSFFGGFGLFEMILLVGYNIVDLLSFILYVGVFLGNLDFCMR